MIFSGKHVISIKKMRRRAVRGRNQKVLIWVEKMLSYCRFATLTSFRHLLATRLLIFVFPVANQLFKKIFK